MGRSRSRSPRHRIERERRGERRRRSRSPRRRSRSPRRRHRSRSPGSSSRRPRSPPGRRHDDRSRREEPNWKTPHDAQALLTLGGSLGVKGPSKKKKKQAVKTTILPINPEDMTDEDKRMQELMGFGSFDTTKNKKVENNDTYAINRKVERKYRQYMNRKGGFNRPLEFMP